MIKLKALPSFLILLMSFSSYAMDQEVRIWQQLNADSTEIVGVMLGVADQLGQIEKSGELFISTVEKRRANPDLEVYRIAGFVVGNDGLVENNFGLVITRLKKGQSAGPNYSYGVLYKEQRIDDEALATIKMMAF